MRPYKTIGSNNECIDHIIHVYKLPDDCDFCITKYTDTMNWWEEHNNVKREVVFESESDHCLFV